MGLVVLASSLGRRGSSDRLGHARRAVQGETRAQRPDALAAAQFHHRVLGMEQAIRDHIGHFHERLGIEAGEFSTGKTTMKGLEMA